jgi:hypothetical protein
MRERKNPTPGPLGMNKPSPQTNHRENENPDGTKAERKILAV